MTDMKETHIVNNSGDASYFEWIPEHLHVDLGKVTIGDDVGVDPRALMLYLRDLGIDFIFEAGDNITQLKLLNCSRLRGGGVSMC